SIAAVISRQQRRRIDVQREQVANGVLVFRAVEPMERFRSTGVRVISRGTIQRALEPGDEPVVGFGVWAWSAARRHQAGAKLSNDLFPRFSVAANVRQVEGIKHQTGRFCPLIVTAY